MSETTVYLAGPLSDGENPHAWHERIQELADCECINPFTIHPDGAVGSQIHKRDLEAVRESDVMLLRYMTHVEICGAYIEAGVAYENDVPVVVWNPEGATLPEFLRWHADAIEPYQRDALAKISTHAR